MAESTTLEQDTTAPAKSFAELVGLSGNDFEYLYRVGHREFEQEKYDDADTTFRMLCLIDHGNPRNWLALGATRQKRGDYLGAIEAYTVVPDLGDFNPRAALYAAECFIVLGAPSEAMAGLDQAIDWAENDPDPGKILDQIEVLSETVELMLAAGPESDESAEPAITGAE